MYMYSTIVGIHVNLKVGVLTDLERKGINRDKDTGISLENSIRGGKLGFPKVEGGR